MENSLIVYQNKWIIEKVYRVSDRLSRKVTDTTMFEDRSIKRVGEYLRQNVDNVHNKQYIIKLINEVASAAIARNSNEEAQRFSELTYESEEGDETAFEPLDDFTYEKGFGESVVESEFNAKETADLLAQDDRRKLLIIEQWLYGNDNNSDISRVLADSLGGNPDSYRRYIHRFRDECRELLAAI